MPSRRSSDEPPTTAKKANRYGALLLRIFTAHYRPGATKFEFARSELETAAGELKIALPKNRGDLIYSFRFRTVLPPEIVQTATPAGQARYRMSLLKENRVVPSDNKYEIKIPAAVRLSPSGRWNSQHALALEFGVGRRRAAHWLNRKALLLSSAQRMFS